MSGQTYQKTKTSKSSGTNSDFKKDGYGANRPPGSMVPTKTGKTKTVGYTGPNVQRGKF